MALTAMPATDPDARTELVTAFADLANFYARCTDAPLPGGVYLNIKVPGAARQEKILALHRIAAALDVPVTERDGVLYAERQFGPVTLEAHVERDAARRHAGTQAAWDEIGRERAAIAAARNGLAA